MPHTMRPKILNLFEEGYGLASLRKDAIAGLTVAIVALPLSMAIAIASHAPPQSGLFSAIIGGFLISLLGGSRFQIGGPAGAFIVLVSGIIDTHGLDGLLLATMMAGLLIAAAGFLRLGRLIAMVPQPVTVGFTAGIAVIIFASQIRDLLGLTLNGSEPAALMPKLIALGAALPTFNTHAVVIAAVTILTIIICRRLDERIPALLVAVVAASLLALALGMNVETIGTRFGSIPAMLPWPSVPAITAERLLTLLPAAASLALLGSIESLLSAVVADRMSNRRHRYNMELVAQGVANLVTPLFGGITVTGTIARTATNVRAGAHGPVSGMLHAIYLLLFMAIAAPLLLHIPLAALAGVLTVVCWNMAGWKEIRETRPPMALMTVAVTFLVTVLHDLIAGIGAGIAVHLLLRLWSHQRPQSP